MNLLSFLLFYSLKSKKKNRNSWLEAYQYIYIAELKKKKNYINIARRKELEYVWWDYAIILRQSFSHWNTCTLLTVTHTRKTFQDVILFPPLITSTQKVNLLQSRRPFLHPQTVCNFRFHFRMKRSLQLAQQMTRWQELHPAVVTMKQGTKLVA